eukprot:5066006-Ditylum_brightwellii.AAC.1
MTATRWLQCDGCDAMAVMQCLAPNCCDAMAAMQLQCDGCPIAVMRWQQRNWSGFKLLQRDGCKTMAAIFEWQQCDGYPIA